MNIQTIKKELNQIYRIRRGWCGAKGTFDKRSVSKRMVILIKQQILENLAEVKNLRKKEKSYLIKRFMRL